MARWGEGDPRWIVEERPDATNVNNWHWTEKNASQWSKDKLKELLLNLKIREDKGECEITEMSKCEGEAVANNRKGKLIFFYEWVLTLKWKGSIDGSDVIVNGKVEIPNLSEEHEANNVDVTMTTKDKTSEADILKEMMRKKGTKLIREKLAIYIEQLRLEFSQGMILPTKDGNNIPRKKPVEKTTLNNTPGQSVNGKKVASGLPLDVIKLTMTENFKCTAEDFYRALTQIEMVQAFTQNPCRLDLAVGGRFELFGGNVSGTFTNLVPDKKICQNWRFKSWPDGHFSQVEIEIKQNEDNTTVHVTQANVPKNDSERTREGWKRYYWDSMRKTFGFGSILF